MSNKKRAKSATPKEIEPPKVFSLGKDSTYFPGQWLCVNAQMKNVGLPTSANHRFFGECKEDGVRHGPGIEIVPGSHKYMGTYENGVRSGLGVLMTNDSSVYRGCFSEGQFSGHGKFIVASRGEVEGEWTANKLNGRGRATFANGMTYEGEFKDDRMTGHGKAQYADGSVYEGDWLDGARHGKGVLILSNGCKYEGEWQHDREHGAGVVHFPSGLTFTATWERGVRLQTPDPLSTTASASASRPTSSVSGMGAPPPVHHDIYTARGPGTYTSMQSTQDSSFDVGPQDYPSCTFASELGDSFVLPIPESPLEAREAMESPSRTQATLKPQPSYVLAESAKFTPYLPLQQRPPTGSRPSSRMSVRDRTISLNSSVADRILRGMSVRETSAGNSSAPSTPLARTLNRSRSTSSTHQRLDGTSRLRLPNSDMGASTSTPTSPSKHHPVLPPISAL